MFNGIKRRLDHVIIIMLVLVTDAHLQYHRAFAFESLDKQKHETWVARTIFDLGNQMITLFSITHSA